MSLMAKNMESTDKQKFMEVIVGAAEIIGKLLSKVALKLYWNALNNYDLKSVVVAVEECIKNPDTGQFMPKPADIIKQIDGGTEDRALIAWTKFERAIRSVGTYDSVVFDDHKIHIVAQDMGGWIKFGKVMEDEMPFLKNEFVKRYRGTREGMEFPNKLVGLIEADCGKHSTKPPLPKLIGDKERATQVLLGQLQPNLINQEAMAL